MYKLLGILDDLLEVKADVMPLHKYSSPQGDDPGKTIPMVDVLENTPSRPFVRFHSPRPAHLCQSDT